MNWTETTILDIESSYVKRMISETIYIKRQDKGLNKNSDCVVAGGVFSNHRHPSSSLTLRIGCVWLTLGIYY